MFKHRCGAVTDLADRLLAAGVIIHTVEQERDEAKAALAQVQAERDRATLALAETHRQVAAERARRQ